MKTRIPMVLLISVVAVTDSLGCDAGTNSRAQIDQETGGQGAASIGTGGQASIGTGAGGGGIGGGFPGSRLCTLLGCGPTWDIRRALPMALTLGELQELTVEVCRNDKCFTSHLADLWPSEPFMMGAGVGRSLSDSPQIEVIFWGTAEEKAGEVEVTWSFGAPGTAGDVYSLELFRRDGTSLLRIAETATYDVYYPNGVDCPPRCERVVGAGG